MKKSFESEEEISIIDRILEWLSEFGRSSGFCIESAGNAEESTDKLA